MKTLCLACFVSLFALAGCGDDGGDTIDAAASIDADVTPDAGPDASMASLCETLCTCASTTCGQDMGECLAECAQIPVSVATCRNTHCGYAQTNASLHCPHVEGDPLGQGTPPDCIHDLGIDAGVPDGGQ